MGPSLKTVTKESHLSKERVLKVLSCKHASASTAIQQAFDVYPLVIVVKLFTKKPTEQHSPAFGLKDHIVNIIDTLRSTGVLILSLPIKKALIEHLATVPEIFTIGMNKRNILKGFIKNDMLDKKLNTFLTSLNYYAPAR